MIFIKFFIQLCVALRLCPDSLNSLFSHSNVKTREHLSRFSTKTRYAHTLLYPHSNARSDKHFLAASKCKLVQTNALFRHGTRNPSAKDIKKSISLHARLSAFNNDEDKANSQSFPAEFKAWQSKFDAKQEKQLTSVGQREMAGLGALYRALLEEHGFQLAGDARHNLNRTLDQLEFMSSSVTRSKQSAAAFYRQLINEVSERHDDDARTDAPSPSSPASPPPSLPLPSSLSIDDQLLRFYDHCPKYVRRVKEHPEARAEVSRFKNSSHMRDVIARFKQRWALPAEFAVSAADMKTIFVMCASELSIHERPGEGGQASGQASGQEGGQETHVRNPASVSPWCGLLERNDFAVPEYLYELKHFWIKAKGYKINYLQSCPLLTKMMEDLRRAAHLWRLKNNNNDDTNETENEKNEAERADKLKRGVFSFAHAETVIPVVTLLGLFAKSSSSPPASSYTSNADKLRADNFESWRSEAASSARLHHVFRSSLIAPFSGHVTLNLYDCGGDDDATTTTTASSSSRATRKENAFDDMFVQLLLNEQPVAWPIASSATSSATSSSLAPLSAVLARYSVCKRAFDHHEVCGDSAQTVQSLEQSAVWKRLDDATVELEHDMEQSEANGSAASKNNEL